MKHTSKKSPILFLVALLASCGGGSTSTPPPNSAVISFSLISTQTLPFRISGVQLSTRLPAGVTVETVTGSTKEIASGLFAGSAVAGVVTPTFPIFGRYSSPVVSVVVADGSGTGTGFGPGEMARVTCSVAPGTSIDVNQLLTQFTFKAAGIDPVAAVNPSPLNPYLTPRISVSYQ